MGACLSRKSEKQKTEIETHLTKVDLSVEIAGIQLRNPTMTAPGPTSRDGLTLKKQAEGGVGALVAKTISVAPGAVPKPHISVADRRSVFLALLNTETWSEIPYQRWIEKEYRIAKKTGLPVFASMGYSASDLRKLGPLVEKAGVDAIEFSLHYVGTDYKPILKIAKALRESVDVPIFPKLSPHITNPIEFSKELERVGVNGIVAINTYGPCLHIDIETGRPALGSESGYGWMSGAALKPLAIRYVADVAKAVKIPVIGCGGIMKGTDAVEHIMAGASAVQICTGAILHGPSIYGKVANEIDQFMQVHGYDSLEDMRGIALKHMPEKAIMKMDPPLVNAALCTNCRLCQRICPYEAITVEEIRSKKFSVAIDKDKCYQCGLCVSLCPSGVFAWGSYK